MRTTIAVVVLMVSLVACSSDEDDNGGNDLLGNYPSCSDTWVDGETLPEDYEGCDEGDTIIAGVSYECQDGSRIFTYEPEGSGFYTLADGTIVEVGEDYANDPEYGELFDACTG